MGGYKDWPKGAWSHTQWSELRRCQRAHNLHYKQRIYRLGPTPLALEIGTAFHKGMEHVGEIASWGAETALEDWEEASRKARQIVKDPAAGIEATRLLGSYHREYGVTNGGHGKNKILAVEEVLLGGNLHKDIGGYAAIADAVIEEPDGTIVLYEYKTAGRMPSGTLEELEVELKVGSQACSLAYCGRLKWGKPPVVVRDITTKTNKVGHKRIRMTFTDAELDRWEQDQIDLEQLNGLTCANRDACDPPTGYRCNYFDYCWGSEEAREKMYVKREAG